MAADVRETEQIILSFECDGTAGAGWVVGAVTHTEELSEPYRTMVHVSTPDESVEPVLMLGQSATLTILRGDVMRTITGIVTEVQEGSTAQQRVTANLVIEPALEALRHRVNTRIFQEMTVPEILEEVLGEGLGAYARAVENRLRGSYLRCDYRVQYDETDLAFCERLMEEEGIFYFFEHGDGPEVMVLGDSDDVWTEVSTLHGPSATYSELGSGVGGHELVSRFEIASQLEPTKVKTRHFDWTAPSVPVEGESSETAGAGDVPNGASVRPDREVYQHDEQPLTWEPGGLTYGGDKDAQLRVRREEQAWEARIGEGDTTIVSMTAGGLFELTGHPRADLDGRWLVYGATHYIDDGGLQYTNTIHCVPEGVPWRPKRVTPKPRIASIQTATVVGPSGEEIHTDEHGRVKVQFHWDRLGALDERSSCWVRVMQPWAGAGWGFVFIPRIGMEVIVDFLGGDPDRPVIVGAVYNGEHPPPYSLPDEKTKSTIKTESSLGGDGYNELRFEDKAGEEEIFTHAQKDQNEEILNDHTTTVHHDQTITIDNDQTQTVHNDQTEHVMNDQSLEVDANRTIRVHGSFTETIDGNETRTVSSGVNETIDAGETRTVTGGMTESISANREQTINGPSAETITGSLTQSIGGGAKIETPASYMITAAGGFEISAPAGTQFTALGGYTLLAPGGTRSHDSFFDKIGNTLFELYGGEMALTSGLKMELVAAFQCQINGTNIERKAVEIACVTASDDDMFIAKPETNMFKLQAALDEMHMSVFNKE